MSSTMGKLKPALLVASSILVIICVFALLFYRGDLLFNDPSPYPVRGVDVSSYQGDIDWEILSNQNIHFAFIKATEGSSFVDEYFVTNFVKALNTELRVGAYHFFSSESKGKTQAENFISNVPKDIATLPPVVDFELYGSHKRNLPGKDEMRRELDILLKELEAHYGVKPIIYATEKDYDIYLSGYYGTYDIWIRNVFTHPKEPQDQDWTFWQYSNRGRLYGYAGEERYIDLNVFYGTLEEFYSYGTK